VERREGPVALVLTRQGVPVLPGTAERAVAGVSRGAYVIAEPERGPDLVLVATGSEVALAVEAARRLAEEGVAARVVSMPSWELFDGREPGYREELLPEGIPRLAVEAGVSRGWRDWVGEGGAVVGLDRFGASAPGPVAYGNLGFSVERVMARARMLLAGRL